MLVSCYISNYKSINKKQGISLCAFGQNSYADNIYYFKDDELYFSSSKNISDRKNKNRLLKIALLTGRNGCGKSNFLEGIRFFKRFFTVEKTSLFDFDTFCLSDETEFTTFSIDFIHNKNYLQYSIELDKEHEIIISEKLLVKGTGKKSFDTVFHIYNGELLALSQTHIKSFGIKDYFLNNTNRSLIKILQDCNDAFIRDNFTSFFEKLAILNRRTYDKSNKFYYFKEKLKELLLKRKLGESSEKLELLERIVTNLDAHIKGLDVESIADMSNAHTNDFIYNSKFIDAKLLCIQNKYDAEGNVIGKVAIDFVNTQSEAIRDIIYLVFAIIESLENATPIFIDDFGDRLHHKLADEIIYLYKRCRRSSQLIFTTHDDNLLDLDFRKDQIFILDKNEKQETVINPLVETDFRNDLSTTNQYRIGKFGSYPKINLEFLKDNPFMIEK